MRVVHEPADGGDRTLATDVEVADSFVSQFRGLMFRSSIPDDYALVFDFSKAQKRSVHMLFVRFPIDVMWVVDGTIERVSTLSPWTGLGYAQADTILELPAGAADDVEAGDTVRVE